MPLVFIDRDKVEDKEVLIIEYSGFKRGFIESILDKYRIKYKNRGGAIIVEDDIKKTEIKKILVRNGVDLEDIVVSGERLSFKYLFKRISTKKGLKLVCPRCGSTKVRKASILSGWLTPLQFICEDCGYIGTVFLEVEE